MKPEFIGIALVAVLWGGYPLLTRAANSGHAFGTFILMSAGWVVIAAAVLWQGFEPRPNTAATIKLSIAGVMMGIGLLAFNSVASSRRMDASVSIPIMDTAMLVVTVIAAVWFFAEPFTIRKGIGLSLLLAGIATLHSS
jgi:drug/metabolite transporter (DMT)-like permease